MALRFPFRSVPIGHAAVTLRGQRARLRPIVDLSVLGSGGMIVREALLDTGADEVVMDEAEAPRLGIDLSLAPTNISAGVGSPTLLIRYAPVQLRLTDGIEFREWPALVGFAPVRLNRVLFGFAGGLQFFTATFLGDQTSVEREINPLYPGT